MLMLLLLHYIITWTTNMKINREYNITTMAEYFEVFKVKTKETVFVSLDPMECISKVAELNYPFTKEVQHESNTYNK